MPSSGTSSLSVTGTTTTTSAGARSNKHHQLRPTRSAELMSTSRPASGGSQTSAGGGTASHQHHKVEHGVEQELSPQQTSFDSNECTGEYSSTTDTPDVPNSNTNMADNARPNRTECNTSDKSLHPRALFSDDFDELASPSCEGASSPGDLWAPRRVVGTPSSVVSLVRTPPPASAPPPEPTSAKRGSGTPPKQDVPQQPSTSATGGFDGTDAFSTQLQRWASSTQNNWGNDPAGGNGLQQGGQQYHQNNYPGAGGSNSASTTGSCSYNNGTSTGADLSSCTNGGNGASFNRESFEHQQFGSSTTYNNQGNSSCGQQHLGNNTFQDQHHTQHMPGSTISVPSSQDPAMLMNASGMHQSSHGGQYQTSSMQMGYDIDGSTSCQQQQHCSYTNSGSGNGNACGGLAGPSHLQPGAMSMVTSCTVNHQQGTSMMDHQQNSGQNLNYSGSCSSHNNNFDGATAIGQQFVQSSCNQQLHHQQPVANMNNGSYAAVQDMFSDRDSLVSYPVLMPQEQQDVNSISKRPSMHNLAYQLPFTSQHHQQDHNDVRGMHMGAAATNSSCNSAGTMNAYNQQHVPIGSFCADPVQSGEGSKESLPRYFFGAANGDHYNHQQQGNVAQTNGMFGTAGGSGTTCSSVVALAPLGSSGMAQGGHQPVVVDSSSTSLQMPTANNGQNFTFPDFDNNHFAQLQHQQQQNAMHMQQHMAAPANSMGGNDAAGCNGTTMTASTGASSNMCSGGTDFYQGSGTTVAGSYGPDQGSASCGQHQGSTSNYQTVGTVGFQDQQCWHYGTTNGTNMNTAAGANSYNNNTMPSFQQMQHATSTNTFCAGEQPATSPAFPPMFGGGNTTSSIAALKPPSTWEQLPRQMEQQQLASPPLQSGSSCRAGEDEATPRLHQNLMQIMQTPVGTPTGRTLPLSQSARRCAQTDTRDTGNDPGRFSAPPAIDGNRSYRQDFPDQSRALQTPASDSALPAAQRTTIASPYFHQLQSDSKVPLRCPEPQALWRAENTSSENTQQQQSGDVQHYGQPASSSQLSGSFQAQTVVHDQGGHQHQSLCTPTPNVSCQGMLLMMDTASTTAATFADHTAKSGGANVQFGAQQEAMTMPSADHHAASAAGNASGSGDQNFVCPEAVDADGNEFSSVGSKYHSVGMCKPCAFVHRQGGCSNGKKCDFCHDCPPGEIKRRKKEKQKLRVQQGLQAKNPAPGGINAAHDATVLGNANSHSAGGAPSTTMYDDAATGTGRGAGLAGQQQSSHNQLAQSASRQYDSNCNSLLASPATTVNGFSSSYHASPGSYSVDQYNPRHSSTGLAANNTNTYGGNNTRQHASATPYQEQQFRTPARSNTGSKSYGHTQRGGGQLHQSGRGQNSMHDNLTQILVGDAPEGPIGANSSTGERFEPIWGPCEGRRPASSYNQQRTSPHLHAQTGGSGSGCVGSSGGGYQHNNTRGEQQHGGKNASRVVGGGPHNSSLQHHQGTSNSTNNYSMQHMHQTNNNASSTRMNTSYNPAAGQQQQQQQQQQHQNNTNMARNSFMGPRSGNNTAASLQNNTSYHNTYDHRATQQQQQGGGQQQNRSYPGNNHQRKTARSGPTSTAGTTAHYEQQIQQQQGSSSYQKNQYNRAPGTVGGMNQQGQQQRSYEAGYNQQHAPQGQQYSYSNNACRTQQGGYNYQHRSDSGGNHNDANGQHHASQANSQERQQRQWSGNNNYNNGGGGAAAGATTAYSSFSRQQAGAARQGSQHGQGVSNTRGERGDNSDSAHRANNSSSYPGVGGGGNCGRNTQGGSYNGRSGTNGSYVYNNSVGVRGGSQGSSAYSSSQHASGNNAQPQKHQNASNSNYYSNSYNNSSGGQGSGGAPGAASAYPKNY
ncbi:unnamed protein product [Amoebophrya sp. A120]|nr:unnamed protein product [Amoebophrya sp. A120]|eukprot:GSA120T00002224001.1